MAMINRIIYNDYMTMNAERQNRNLGSEPHATV